MEVRREELALYHQKQQAAFLKNYKPSAGVMVDLHWHEACEILYVRRGWGVQRINAELAPFHMGDVMIVCPGDVHATEATAGRGSDIDVIQFTDALLPAGSSVREMLSSGVIHPDEDGFGRIFDALAQYAGQGQPGGGMLTAGLIQVLIGLILRSGTGEKPGLSPLIEEVCAWAEQEKDLRLERAADWFGYSPEHLSRRFRAETGISYRTYCDRIRMRRAAALLDEERSLAEVAERLNYSDDSSFIRAFRQMYGITPGAYRRLCRPVNE